MAPGGFADETVGVRGVAGFFWLGVHFFEGVFWYIWAGAIYKNKKIKKGNKILETSMHLSRIPGGVIRSRFQVITAKGSGGAL